MVAGKLKTASFPVTNVLYLIGFFSLFRLDCLTASSTEEGSYHLYE